MKKIIYISIFSVLITLTSCHNQTGEVNNEKPINLTIPVNDFEKKLSLKDAQLVDVRTAEEFNQGHLKGALNYDINSAEFQEQLSKLDKNKPVLVYCLSGGRSSSAAGLMVSQGFDEVYNMDGGIIKWNAANKPLDTETTGNTSDGLSVEDFNKMVRSEKLVLVDYNAKWCQPCKRMAPMLDAFVDKRKDKLLLLKIDADENQDLLRQKGIEAIPVLELYKDGKLVWKHEGELKEEELINEIKL